MSRVFLLVLVSSIGLHSRPGSAAQCCETGLFGEHTDIGAVARAGAYEHDVARDTYTVTGGGENMWFAQDAFHFAWKQLTCDFVLAADIRWPKPGGNAHRKACLMVRQSLAPDAACAYVAVHGDGLTSLQFRERPGAATREIQAAVRAPHRVALERRGDRLTLLLGDGTAGGELSSSGASVQLPFALPFYLGVGVCAHDNQALETAVFSNLTFAALSPPTGAAPALESTLEVVPIASRDRRVVYHAREHFEAPNWSRDGRHLLFNSKGRLYRLPVSGGQPEQVDTGAAVKCNNDHGYSPDGTQIAISDQTETGASLIYVLPAAGGTPRRVTPVGPSYWHGWSPDGRTLAYCAERAQNYDIYTIPVEGGEERRLTTAPGLDDGPDYTADGQYLYFNSERTGRMKLWRMRTDGSAQEQVTFDDANDWFPHPSPDGRWLVFLSYAPEVKGHPANHDVTLRIMPLAGGKIEVLARLFGGQGTLNVPSWSPDSRQVAFVSYRLVPR